MKKVSFKPMNDNVYGKTTKGRKILRLMKDEIKRKMISEFVQYKPKIG